MNLKLLLDLGISSGTIWRISPLLMSFGECQVLDSLVKAAEKFAELLKYRADRDARRFERLVEPTFDQMEKVHVNYVALYRRAREVLSSNESVESFSKEFGDLRLAEDAVRNKHRGFARGLLSEPGLEEMRKYFAAISDYLEGPKLGKNWWVSKSVELNYWIEGLVEREERTGVRREERDEACKKLSAKISELNARWIVVAEEYARLKARLQ